MAVMSWEMFEALVDTIEILSDPELMTGINESEKAISEGRTVALNEVLAELAINLDQMPPDNAE